MEVFSIHVFMLIFCFFYYRKRPDQTWVQCDSCLKWRKLPDGIDQLPEKWYCSNNPDPQFRYQIVGSVRFGKEEILFKVYD